MAGGPCPTGATVEEAEAFLAAHPEVEAIDLVLTDANGIGRGKIIRRHELLDFYRQGRHLPISILGLDILGEDVHETGLIWDHGDGDLLAWPVPGTLVPLHGTAPARGEVLMTMHELDGRPMSSDPRHALAAQEAALAAEGMQATGAFELEFFLFEPERGPDGRLRPARDLISGVVSPATEVYAVDHLLGLQPFFADVYAGAALAGITAETAISEYAPGQFELTLRYRTGMLAAADDLIRLKRIVRAAARAHGLLACFMAKPVEDHAGSGMHLHVGLRDRQGRNLLIEDRPGTWHPRLLHALGGLRATMAESMLVFAPHANSWRRFAARSYAPLSPSWGVNNRSVALRIPAGAAEARRIEHRPAGVDANPYLVAATVLAGVRHGLAERIDPGPETTGDAYASLPEASGMPEDWRSAIAAARGSAFLRGALGPDLHRTFTAIKAAELARVARTVTELDYRLYLHRL